MKREVTIIHPEDMQNFRADGVRCSFEGDHVVFDFMEAEADCMVLKSRVSMPIQMLHALLRDMGEKLSGIPQETSSRLSC